MKALALVELAVLGAAGVVTAYCAHRNMQLGRPDVAALGVLIVGADVFLMRIVWSMLL